MAQNISIWGANYTAVPAVTLPKTGGGNATFTDTSDAGATADDLLEGKTAYVNGVKLTGTYTPQTVNLQAKTNIAPTTSSQTITPDQGYDGLSSVQINAMPTGSATTPATTITANPTISVSASGLITASVSKTQGVTPTVSAGYVSTGTSGTITVSGSNTSQLTIYQGGVS